MLVILTVGGTVDADSNIYQNNILIHMENGKAIPQIADFGRAIILNDAICTGSLLFNVR
jgi:hypothetical protein